MLTTYKSVWCESKNGLYTFTGQGYIETHNGSRIAELGTLAQLTGRGYRAKQHLRSTDVLRLAVELTTHQRELTSTVRLFTL